jgi:hypothetical protein
MRNIENVDLTLDDEDKVSETNGFRDDDNLFTVYVIPLTILFSRT